MISNKKQRGFTLVELSLAMSFLSILLVSIVLLIVQIINIYDRGVTLRAVEQAGVALVAELKQAINQANPDNIEFVDFTEDGGKYSGGRLCTGSKTFIWNSGDAIASTPTDQDILYPSVNKYTDLSGSAAYDIRFVVVNDSGNGQCAQPLPALTTSTGTDLLKNEERNLVIHKFTLAAGPLNIHNISLTLGTNNPGEQQEISGEKSCLPPASLGGRNDFCAVNIFNFTARAGNEDNE